MRKMSFEDWKRAVDHEVNEKLGIGANDLPDQPWRQWYDEGKSAKVAAAKGVAARKDAGM